jgi:hypothetical protein
VGDAFGFGLAPATVQVLPQSGAVEVRAADVGQFVHGGLDLLGGADVVTDTDQADVAADGDAVGGAEVAAAGGDEFVPVAGLVDEVHEVVEGVGRVVALE